MTTDTHADAFGQRLMVLFEAVLELDEAAREARIAEVADTEPALADAVRALLVRDAQTGALRAHLSAEVEPLLREALPSLPSDPQTIGPYAVLRRLGEGGMGRVYLARRADSPVAQNVAIKLIRSDRVSPGLLDRFEAERRHLAALDHPGICRFIDAASLADGTPYVVMEAVEGVPIIDYCAQRELGIEARLKLLRKLLAAVAHAHDRLLVHRDIKPQNVLVTADGEPKLLDFGIAKSIEAEQASQTRTAERFFTPNASAPEQLLGGAFGVGCDVYALGALAYELLSGHLPFDFDGLRAAEIERLILQVAPPLMSERAPTTRARELHGDLDAIVATCLRKSPAERYANVSALDSDLARYLEGRPVEARAPTWIYRAKLFVRRHRVSVGFSAALVLAISTLSAGLALQAQESERAALLLEDMFLSGEEESLSAYGMDLSGFFARAVDRAIREDGFSPARRLNLLHVLATRSAELNNIDASEKAAKAALDISTKIFGDSSSQYAESADRLSRIILYNRGPSYAGEVQPLLARSAEVHALNSSSPEALLLHFKAMAYLGQALEDHEMMLDYSRRALDVMRNEEGTSLHVLLNLQTNLSATLSIAGRQAEATREADEALVAADALLDNDDSPANRELWRYVAATACEHRARNRNSNAVALCRRVLSDLDESGITNTRAGFDVLFWLGYAQAINESAKAALETYMQASAVLTNLEGEKTAGVEFHRVGVAIARANLELNDYASARARLEPALEFYQSRYSRTHPIAVATRINLLQALSGLGLLTSENELLAEDFDINLLPEHHQLSWKRLSSQYQTSIRREERSEAGQAKPDSVEN